MIRRIQSILLIFFLTHTIVLTAINPLGVITELCRRYTRDITVLEIGAASGAYLFTLANKYPGSYILMDRHLQYQDDKLAELTYKNVVLLHPTAIDCPLLSNLGKCEHFDIVIIRDFEHWAASHVAASLDAALTLGDHIFIELPARLVPTVQAVRSCEAESIAPEKSLCYFAMHKTYITKARWTSHEENISNYGIVSNFSEKRMDKQSTNTTSKWIPGINLLTFLVLKGVYPTDKMMRKQLKSFKHINHNDLVLGNIVVQGSKIKPIDFKDKRRNVDPAICVKAALKMVIREGRLAKNPEAMLHKYSEYLQRHKRRMRS